MNESGDVPETIQYNSDLEEIRRQRLARRKKIRLSIIGAVCLLIAFFAIYQFTDIIWGLSEEMTSASEGNDWSMFGRDLMRSGSTGPSGKIPEGTPKWIFATGGPVHSSPAVSDGTVYIGSRDNYVYAIDAETGLENWKFKTESWVQSSPVVAEGVVYVGSNDSKIYALDAVTGEKLWDFEAKYAVRSSPAVSNGMLYFGSDDYYIYALNLETGEEAWRFKTDHYIQSSPVVVGGIVYVGSVDGFLYAINANNGKLRLKYDSRSMVIASPVVVDGTVYFMNTQGWVYAIDAAAKNWPFEHKALYYWNALYLYGVAPRPPAPSGFIWVRGLMGRSNSSLSYSDGVLFMGVENRIVSLDTENQTQLWEFVTSGRITSSPAIEDGVVYFGSGDGNFYAVKAADGTELWKAATGDEITSSPAIDHGVVYIGSHDGNLYAFE
jgi:outer membrane protein assembly factor BamB